MVGLTYTGMEVVDAAVGIGTDGTGSSCTGGREVRQWLDSSTFSYYFGREKEGIKIML